MEVQPAGVRASTIEPECGEQMKPARRQTTPRTPETSEGNQPSDGMCRPMHSPALPVVPTCVKGIPTLFRIAHEPSVLAKHGDSPFLESAEFSATFRRPIACARSLRATAP